MESEATPPVPEPQNQEPTVLDLFKSVTRDWKSFFNFVGSLISEERRAAVDRAAAAEAQRAAQPVRLAEPEWYAAPAVRTVRFPLRAVLGVILALLAQSIFEPPGSPSSLGLALYVFAIGLVIWSYFSGEWLPPPLRESVADSDPMTIRLIPLLLSGVLSAWAFFAMGANLFTWGNLILWLLAIYCFFWAAWLRQPPVLRSSQDAQILRKQWVWAALIVAVLGLSMFFRLNQVGGIPAEPFSDHAEKILDIYEISQGQTNIFFPRNTGREAFQMYWTLLVLKLFGTGFSFLSLKLGTALLGLLTLPYVYLLGKELGGPRLGLLAMFLAGISYWLNVISRIGLRFPLYPLFVAPTLFYLLRGLRTRNRNDFLLTGLFLGLGLHGYSPFRIVPILVVLGFIIFALHPASREVRKQMVWWLGITAITAGLVFLPLLRYSLDHLDSVSYRAISRLGSIENPLPGPPLQIFFTNLWVGLKMFNVNDGEIWVNSVVNRPALDVVSAALFLLGAALLVTRYLRRRDWRDIFLLVSIVVLMLPSVLSLAYPGENPALNRASGAAVPVFLIAGLALDGLITAFGSSRWRMGVAWALAIVLLAASAWQNYDLVFRQFNTQFRLNSWNSSEMGGVIAGFRSKHGRTDTVWIVPYPHWVDTRLPGVWAGIPDRDFALFREHLAQSQDWEGPKMFLYKPEDSEAEHLLLELYPQGVIRRYTSAVNPSKDFMIFSVEQ